MKSQVTQSPWRRKCTESLEANRDDPIMLNKRAGYYLQLQQYEQALDDALYSVKLQENLYTSSSSICFQIVFNTYFSN